MRGPAIPAGERAAHRALCHYVSRRYRTDTIKGITKKMNLDCQTVKRLAMRYIQAQFKQPSKPSPQAPGTDEISIRKGHVYHIVVSDLHRQQPI